MKNLDELQWYHKIKLPDGTVTPGWAPLDAPSYRFKGDMTGLRVLDVGAWDGYWTFEALKRGASEVVAIDDFSDNHTPGPGRDKNWETFDLCKAAFGYTDEQCSRREMSVYEISEEVLGRFDIVLAYGLVYHLRYPMLGIDKLANICDGELRIESAVLDFHSPTRTWGYVNEAVAEFCPGDEYAKNPTNWWIPSLRTLTNWCYAAGFRACEQWYLTDSPQGVNACRGFVTARGKNV